MIVATPKLFTHRTGVPHRRVVSRREQEHEAHIGEHIRRARRREAYIDAERLEYVRRA